MKEIVVLGLSGGVDSAVAASLLAEHYDVHCLWLDMGTGAGADDAAALAEQFKLPFHRGDIRAELEHFVCRNFADEYRAGRTPLPCARCNPLVKFPALRKLATELGSNCIATGHYARTAPGPDGRTLLRKGEPANDQSYMLARLTQDLLRYTVFPLGGFEKAQVRALALEKGIAVADKPDSMEICFIPAGDYATWLEARGGMPPTGNFVDEAGAVLGRHLGIHHYTLGQGSGLGLSGPHRYFVSKIDPVTNAVTLSDGSDLLCEKVVCVRPNWISISELTSPMDVTVRLRHSKTETPAVLLPEGSGVALHLLGPVRAASAGQLAVCYTGDVVVGSAWIERSEAKWS